ncbi:TPA: TcfC E-set like domain-containing protein [Photobacterium damselae]|uniref:TcfC E-set like domain-containing protein n=1 Tax=Photobacterium damselae TaxID=38293 RepID=UPI001EE12E47|nr:TcfC E-set like domain-containing protein [Photobacterium damselae]MCG3824129.1 TcfC E-set like domain-containing protein [Photobacterium damselae]
MINKNYSIGLISAISIISSCSISASIPDEFKELYNFKNKQVRLVGIDGEQSVNILLSVNYNSVKLPSINRDNSKNKIKNFLLSNNLSFSLIDRIIKDLSIGVENDPRCVGRLSECVLIPENYSFIYDYDENVLYIKVNKSFLKEVDSTKKYAGYKNNNAGLINHFNLYVNKYENRDGNLSINDESIFGIGYGYFKSDFVFDINEDDKFKLYEGSYNLDFFNKRLSMGHFEDGLTFNATDFLQTNNQYSENSLNFGSSENLLLGDKSNYERLFYYSPSNGELLIYRDDRLILHKNISEGQGFISYSELPKGRYQVRIDTVVAGKVISSDTKQIFNVSTNLLAKNGIDFLLSAGVFEKSDKSELRTNNDKIDSFDNQLFYKGAIAYRPFDFLILGASSLMSKDDYYGRLGLITYLPFDSKLSLVGTYFDQVTHLDSQLSMPNFNIQFEEYKNTDNNILAQYMYGESSYKELNFTSNFQFKHGQSAYITYGLHEQDSVDLYPSYDYWTLSAGIYSPFIFSSSVDVSMDYDSSSEDILTTINWSIPFGDKHDIRTISSVRTQNMEIKEFRQSIEASNFIKNKNINSSLTVGSSYTDYAENIKTDASVSVNGSNEHIRGSSYLYMDTDGTKGFSGSISSSQLITLDDIKLTNKKSDAYLVVNTRSNHVNDTSGFVTLKKNGKQQSKNYIYGSKEIYPLNSYDSYNAFLDSESVSLYNSGNDSFSGFSYPGTIAIVDAKLSKMVSFISSFSDIYEDDITSLECQGDGCVSVEELTTGVYKISLMEGLNFELKAGDNRCVIPHLYQNPDNLNFGNNYCLPTLEPADNILLSKDGKEKNIYYVGAFKEIEPLSLSLNKLVNSNTRILKKTIGGYKALYLESKSKLTDEQSSVLNDLSSLSMANISIDKLELPIVLNKKENK